MCFHWDALHFFSLFCSIPFYFFSLSAPSPSSSAAPPPPHFPPCSSCSALLVLPPLPSLLLLPIPTLADSLNCSWPTAVATQSLKSLSTVFTFLPRALSEHLKRILARVVACEGAKMGVRCCRDLDTLPWSSSLTLSRSSINLKPLLVTRHLLLKGKKEFYSRMLYSGKLSFKFGSSIDST